MKIEDKIPDFARLFSMEGLPDDEVVMTPLSAFYLWMALQICSDYAFDEVEGGDLDDGFLFGQYPLIVRGQSPHWFKEAARSFDDLWGDLEAGRWPTPCCPAEEMALHVAISYVEEMTDANEIAPPDGIPFHLVDGDCELLRECLFEDHDILMLLNPMLDGIEVPDGDANEMLGMGDYRPAAWFVPFHGARITRDPDRGFRRPGDDDD